MLNLVSNKYQIINIKLSKVNSSYLTFTLIMLQHLILNLKNSVYMFNIVCDTRNVKWFLLFVPTILSTIINELMQKCIT